MSARRRAEVTDTRMAGPDHAVHTVEGGSGAYRREPCAECPWRVDAVGLFPAEAFRHSALTAEDLATHTFACHAQARVERPAICAGFLLRGAEHNMAVRMKLSDGRIDPDKVHDGGHELHENYRAMAEANGVEPDDPALARTRD